MENISIILGDITQSPADAVVCAADAPDRCGVGQAVPDPEHPRVIRTRVPVWQGGGHGEAALLRSCCLSCLELALAHGYRTVDFPSIGTEDCGFPLPQAAHVALKAMTDFLREHPDCGMALRLVCRDAGTLRAYRVDWNMFYQDVKPHP